MSFSCFFARKFNRTTIKVQFFETLIGLFCARRLLNSPNFALRHGSLFRSLLSSKKPRKNRREIEKLTRKDVTENGPLQSKKKKKKWPATENVKMYVKKSGRHFGIATGFPNRNFPLSIRVKRPKRNGIQRMRVNRTNVYHSDIESPKAKTLVRLEQWRNHETRQRTALRTRTIVRPLCIPYPPPWKVIYKCEKTTKTKKKNSSLVR